MNQWHARVPDVAMAGGMAREQNEIYLKIF